MKKKFKVLLIMLGLIMPFMANNVYAEESVTQDVIVSTEETEEDNQTYDPEIAKFVEEKLAALNLRKIYIIELGADPISNEQEQKDFQEMIDIIKNEFGDEFTVEDLAPMSDGDVDYTLHGRGIVVKKGNIRYGVKNVTVITLKKITIPSGYINNEEANKNYALTKIKEIYQNLGFPEIAESLVDMEETDYYGTEISNYYAAVDKDGNQVCRVQIINENPIVSTSTSTTEETENNTVMNKIVVDPESGVKINGEELEKTSEKYTELNKKIIEKGYTNIFGAYELKIEEGSIGENGLTLTFNVGEENNRKKALVLHQKHDGTIEEFTGIVEDGVIKITVNELSPFMVALGDVVKEESTTTSNNAGTGTTNIFLCGAMALSAMGGMVYLKKNKKQN